MQRANNISAYCSMLNAAINECLRLLVTASTRNVVAVFVHNPATNRHTIRNGGIIDVLVIEA
jgi:hypothetical protein